MSLKNNFSLVSDLMKICAEKVTLKFLSFIWIIDLFWWRCYLKQFCLSEEAANLISTNLCFTVLSYILFIPSFMCEFFFLHSPSDPSPRKKKIKEQYKTNLCCPVTLQLGSCFFPEWAGVIVTSLDTIVIELWVPEPSTRAVNPIGPASVIIFKMYI